VRGNKKRETQNTKICHNTSLCKKTRARCRRRTRVDVPLVPRRRTAAAAAAAAERRGARRILRVFLVCRLFIGDGAFSLFFARCRWCVQSLRDCITPSSPRRRRRRRRRLLSREIWTTTTMAASAATEERRILLLTMMVTTKKRKKYSAICARVI